MWPPCGRALAVASCQPMTLIEANCLSSPQPTLTSSILVFRTRKTSERLATLLPKFSAFRQQSSIPRTSPHSAVLSSQKQVQILRLYMLDIFGAAPVRTDPTKNNDQYFCLVFISWVMLGIWSKRVAMILPLVQGNAASKNSFSGLAYTHVM